MRYKLILMGGLLTLFTTVTNATNYYINANSGNNNNNGKSKTTAWKNSAPILTQTIQAGDSILFAAEQIHYGMLALLNVSGTLHNEIVISTYNNVNNGKKAIIEAGENLYGVHIKNASFINIINLEITANTTYQNNTSNNKNEMRCGILVEFTNNASYSNITIQNVLVHDVYYYKPGFTIAATETASANGTLSYGWGIRCLNQTETGTIENIAIKNAEVFNVSHTGIKVTGKSGSIKGLEIGNCKVYKTGGPGMQFSGIQNGHIHHNTVSYSGSTDDSRNWGRGSGMWTWSCTNIIIEHNRFEYANGPGDSAGVHIDYNCSHIVVQYNISANNAGGFCEILGNNYNCAYRYNISINDGYREKGKNGAFQEGKIFWLSGYQGERKEKAGPYNSYFYNNTIYVAANITPKIAITSSSNGVLIANNLFYFENNAIEVAGDQKKNEVQNNNSSNVIFTNNVYLHKNNWPSSIQLSQVKAMYGNPIFLQAGGNTATDYIPTNEAVTKNKGILITPLPNDALGLLIGLTVKKDILGNTINGLPDVGAIELQ